MRNLLYFLFVVATLGCVTSWAAEPKAIIEAKATASLGESVWLRTTGSIGNTFIWKVLPSTTEESFIALPIFGGMNEDGTPIVYYWAHFASSKPGNIYFVFVATEDNKSSVAVHELVYGGGDIPIVPTTIDIPTPSPELVSAVSIITPLLKGDKTQVQTDSIALTQFYLDMANTIERDTSSIIKNTDQFRQMNVAAGQLMFQNTGIKGRYSGLADAINKVMADKIGLDIMDITASKRTEIVNLCNAIAWACLQASK